MTKLKICSKFRLFIIISVLIIAIGMAVGTVCHFVADGFFNYGGEFSSYDSVTVNYYSSEYGNPDDVKALCEEHLKDFSAYEVSYTETNLGGEIIYKYSDKTDVSKLEEAAQSLNAALDKNGSGLNSVYVREGKVKEGGSAAIIYASIALASAAAFQFIYFIFRYKLRAALSALLASVHNLGVFVALAAMTRLPLGIEAVAFGAAVVFMTMIATCVFFDKTRKNFADAANAKSDRVDVIEKSAAEVRMISLIGFAAIAAVALILGAFATISSMFIGTFAPYILAVLACVACCYGTLFFTPSVHSAIDALCERSKKKAKPTKAEKSAKNSAVAKEA